MKDNDFGRSPDGGGLSQAEPVSAVSALRASIPSADDAFWGPEIVTDGVCPWWLGAREPYVWPKTVKWLDHYKEQEVSYGRGFAPTTDLWCWQFDDGRPNIVSIRLPADHPFYASGIEARSDETAQQAQPEGQEPGPKGGAQTPSPPTGDDNV